MNSTKCSNLILILLISFLTFFASQLIHASGSGGADRTRANQYELGKKTFQNKLACDQCPLTSIEVNQQTARELLPKLRRRGELGKLLNWSERFNVKVYLKKRYNL